MALRQISPPNEESQKTTKLTALWEEIYENSKHSILAFKGIQTDWPILAKKTQLKSRLLTFESYEHDLDFEICQKAAKQTPYFDQEIRGLIITGVNTLYALQLAKMSHGNICRKTVVVVQPLLFKFIFPSILQQSAKSVNPFFDLNKFSDPIREGLTVDDPKNLVHQVKVDVFHFGLLLLEICTLKDFGEKKLIDIKDLNNSLLTVKMDYSEEIFKLIREMLIIKIERRPDALKLHNILQVQLHQARDIPITRVTPFKDQPTPGKHI